MCAPSSRSEVHVGQVDDEDTAGEVVKRKLVRRRRLRTTLGASAVLVLLVGIILAVGAHQRSLYVEVYEGVLEVRIAIWRYWDANDHPPETLDDLVHGGYIEELPRNPYTGQPTGLVATSAQPSLGNLSWFMLSVDGEVEDCQITGYCPKPSVAEVAWSVAYWNTRSGEQKEDIYDAPSEPATWFADLLFSTKEDYVRLDAELASGVARGMSFEEVKADAELWADTCRRWSDDVQLIQVVR